MAAEWRAQLVRVCVRDHMCSSSTAVSQARPHKSIDTQFVPHEGRSRPVDVR